MAAITAALIKQVREETGAGMMDVKKALTEAEGDVARAKEIIRAKGIQAAGKREGRKAQEGTIASTVVDSANGQTGYAVELNSETDFVAKTPKFVDFSDTVLADAVKADANSIDDVLNAPSADGTVKTDIEEAAALFGEHVKVGQFAKITGPRVEIYAHKKSVEMPPSIVAMIATDEAGAAVAHEAALQISAMGARWLTREDVPKDVVESERRVATEKS
ncbi:MAG: translation elongation factor Ts, partial [Bifidobacterium choerinum]